MGQARDEAGNIWETDAQGNPVRLLQAAGAKAQGGVFTLPPDPIEQAREDRANRAEARAEEASNKPPAGYRWATNGNLEPIPGGPADPTKTGAEGKALRQGDSDNMRKLGDNLANLQSLADSFQPAYGGNIIGGLENMAQGFNSSIGTDGQRQWWADVASIDNLIRNAQFGASLTAGEKAAYEKTTINPSMDPKEVVKNLNQRVKIMQDAASRYTSALKAGGWNAPEIDAYVGSQLQWKPADVQQQEEREKAVAANRTGVAGSPPILTPFDQPSATPMQAASGGTKTVFDPQHAAVLDAMVRAGAPLEQLNAYTASNRLTPVNPASYAAVVAYARKNPNYTGSYVNATKEVPLTRREEISGTPIAAAMMGAGNAFSAGGIEAMAPEQYAMAKDANFLPMLAGEVAGAIGGTKGLGLIGKNTIGRLAPNLVNGGRGSQTARNVLTDSAYGAIYGANTGQNPLATALTAGGGSALGHGAGEAIGRGFTGVTSSPTAKRLMDMGINPTIGQIFRARALDNGGRSVVAGLEDLAANSGFIGTPVNNARNRALEQGNLAALNKVASGVPITEIGSLGIDQLTDVKDAAYKRALDGVSVPAATDTVFQADLAAARSAGQSADAARGRGDYGHIMDRQVAPVVGNAPDISGQQIQDTLRTLQGQQQSYRRAASGPVPDPAANFVADALRDTEGAYTGLVSRNAPQVLPQLKEANAVNRGLSILDDATLRAMNTGGVWNPSQLGDAIKSNAQRFGGKTTENVTSNPLYQLQQDMQNVLPNKVPPTGVNAAPALAVLGAGSAGTGYATDNEWLKTLGALALLTTPYTKSGQAAAAKALLNRTAGPIRIGSAIRKHKGLIGSAAVPLALESGN